jgi:hypothetical protein
MHRSGQQLDLGSLDKISSFLDEGAETHSEATSWLVS